MSVNFLDHIRDIEDPRVPGMVLYPLDEMLLMVLVGLLCRAEDFDEIDDTCTELLDWLRLFVPFKRKRLKAAMNSAFRAAILAG